MPICVNVQELACGMMLYQPVCNEYTVLLPPGKLLDQRDIDALRRRFPERQVMIADPLLDDVYEFHDDSKDRETGRHVQQTLSQAMGGVRKKLVGRAHIRSQDILSLHRVAVEIMQYLRDNPVTTVLLDKTRNTDTYLQQHSANVFYLSMVVGNAIKQYIVDERERLSRSSYLERSYALGLVPLAMGCLLHDIGMLDLEDIYTTVGGLTTEQRARLHDHPLVGERMLPETLSPVARMVVRTHHENFNGTGYPHRTPGDKLHVFSRIIRVADAFDAATSPRVYKGAKSEVRLLWEMSQGPTREHYDPVISKIFAHVVHPFPIGSRLKLSNGMTGVVVRQNINSPFYPHVVIAFDQNDRRLAQGELKPPLNLWEHRDLQIVSFKGEDLSYLYACSALKAEEPAEPQCPAEALSFAYP